MEDEGRSAGDRAPGLANDSLGDTHSNLPSLEREAEERQRRRAAEDEDGGVRRSE
jgi:hypothetical protein